MILTSFSDKGYQVYGKRFIETFIENWSDEQLTVYYESKPADAVQNDRVHWVHLFEKKDVQNVMNMLKNSNEIFHGVRPNPKADPKDPKSSKLYDYRYDAYRFCRKVFAVCDYSLRSPTEKFAWVDADVIIHSKVPEGFLNQILPDDKVLASLERDWSYTETGFVVFNPSHTQFDTFIKAYDSSYKTGAFRFLGEWHDCYILDFLRLVLRLESVNIAEGLDMDHPFVNSILGQYMDHLKGPERKKVGKSMTRDIMVDHKNSYWRKSA